MTNSDRARVGVKDRAVAQQSTDWEAEKGTLTGSGLSTRKYRLTRYLNGFSGAYVWTRCTPAGDLKAILAAGWQPIDSAPRDGSEILLWGRCERDGQFFGYDHNVGWWSEADTSPTGDAGWMARDLPIEPSHWMPLPSPPALKQSTPS